MVVPMRSWRSLRSNGAVEGLQHARGDDDRLVLVDVLEEDAELVAAEAGGRVLGPDRLDEAGRHQADQRVTLDVAEGVVDGLEVVEVEEQDRRAPGVVAAPAERVAEAVDVQGPVGEAGERVGERLPGQLLLERLPAGRVADGEDETAILGQAGRHHLDGQPGAALLDDLAGEALALPRGKGAMGFPERGRRCGRDDGPDVPADELARFVVDRRRDGRAGELDRAAPVDDHAGVGPRGEERPDQRVRLGLVGSALGQSPRLQEPGDTLPGRHAERDDDRTRDEGGLGQPSLERERGDEEPRQEEREGERPAARVRGPDEDEDDEVEGRRRDAGTRCHGRRTDGRAGRHARRDAEPVGLPDRGDEDHGDAREDDGEEAPAVPSATAPAEGRRRERGYRDEDGRPRVGSIGHDGHGPEQGGGPADRVEDGPGRQRYRLHMGFMGWSHA